MYEMNEKKTRREHFEELPSTNDYAKEKRAEGGNLIVTATRQTSGRGTKGRLFVSGEGGVYLSKLTFYEDFPAKDAFKIMANAAVAVCETLSFFGLRPCIKWVNDVYVDDKKICGILIENVFRGGNVSSSVVGIGLNVNNRLPQELQGIATTMEQALGRPCLVKDVEEKLITELEKDRAMSDYIERVGYLGREATLIFGDERVHGVLLSVDEEGGLWVKIGDKKRRLTAAEVSVRL